MFGTEAAVSRLTASNTYLLFLDMVQREKPKPAKPVKAEIIFRKEKHPVGGIGRAITREEIKSALSEIP